jgi:hypothetical protein
VTDTDEIKYYFDFKGSNEQYSYRDNCFNFEQFWKMDFHDAHTYSVNNKDAPKPGLPSIPK